MTIMSVDDSLMMRKIVSHSTGFIEGINVVEAEDGKDAFVKLNDNNIDLFILDINMPKMNGIDFVRNLRKMPNYGTTPVVMLSTDDEEKCKKNGLNTDGLLINEWILKPVTVQKLKDVVNKYIK